MKYHMFSCLINIYELLHPDGKGEKYEMILRAVSSCAMKILFIS